MFIQNVKHYHQWLHTAIPYKTKFGQIPSDTVRVQGPSKRPSSGHLYPVSSVKECNRKGGKCKISLVLQSSVPSTQASPKVETSHRPKQAQHFLHVEKFKMETPESNKSSLIPGKWVSLIDLSDANLHIPIHPNSRKYLKVLIQVPGVPVHLPPIRTSHSPQVFTMIVKEVKLMALSRGLRLHQYLDDWLIRSQSQEEAQVNTQAVVDLTQSLGWIINQKKSELKPTQVFLFVGYKCHLYSALVKPTQETQVKTCLDWKMFDVANSVACLNGENGPGGTPTHEAEHWRYPQSLDSLFPWTEAIAAHLDWWQNPSNVMRGADLHPKDHSIQLFTDASNESWGAHLDQSSTKGLWSDREKRLHIDILELKAVSLALRSFKDQFQDQTVLVAMYNSTVVAYINKQGGTHSAEMCALLWKIMTRCHHHHLTLKARHIPGCLNVMADLLSRSNQVQSTEWSLHPQVFKQICQKWFTPHVGLFATHLNHKLPLYISYPKPKGRRCSEHKLDGSHCLCLPSNGSPSHGDPKNQAMPLPDHRNSPRLARDALVLGPSAALNRDPTATSGVNDSSQTVPKLCVSQQSATSQPPCLVSRSGQLQEQGFSVKVAERIAAPQRSSTSSIFKSKWALFEKWCRENAVDFSTPSVKQVSDFFMYLY